MNRDQYAPSIEVCAAHYGEESESVKKYMYDGLDAALKLDNRGPIKFDDSGRLHPEIMQAYQQHGLYIFTGVISSQEMKDIEDDLAAVKARFPTDPESKTDALGNPAIGADSVAPALAWSKPLSDPLGGTDTFNGRHQVKLKDLKAADDAPDFVPLVLFGSLQHSDSALRMYAHPELLKVAASINGDDFAPFNEVLFIKEPKHGAAVAWHQDGDTHWDNPDYDGDIHGFNFMAQVYGSTPVNGVWVLPGSHVLGKVDIKALVESSGGERLNGAVPIVCEAGDVVICNRQLVHGSFANAGFEPRITINFGFHRRSSVLGVKGAGIHSESVIYDEEHIRKRTEVLGYAIEARRLQYPEEQHYRYQPFAESGAIFKWDENARDAIKDYNLLDLSI